MISAHNLGINSRVILTAIIPVIIFALVFGLYFNNTRNQDLINELNERGYLMASNLAAASEFPVATSNIDQLRILTDTIMNQKDVVGVRIEDEAGKQLFKRGRYGGEGKGEVSQYPADIISRAFEDAPGSNIVFASGFTVNQFGSIVRVGEPGFSFMIGMV